MKITVTLEVAERYETLATNEVALELPGGIPKGAELVKEHLTGFVQDAIDVLIPQTITDLDEKIAALAISADPAESDEDRPDSGVQANPLNLPRE